ncbi:YbjQ family protein [Dechloromonas sp. XY25]|uniref:YbjQ family protein n=1 Tax=Dechloromonas hankyongensis TaxID=2908002 RepID=A0ABS9K2S2_9RHOO|nr:hypothetical protein [Dechloromonas hankyongensis]MCG2577450.1 YbjQ family protein [Dechloromonas hankyongensis]
MTPTFRNTFLRLCLIAAAGLSCTGASAQSVLLDHRTATYGNPWHGSKTGPSAHMLNNKTLVTFNSLPAQGDFEILGRIEVYSRWFGSTRKALAMLGEKARSLGANAVVEASVWQAPAFPAAVAPHGTGIAVHIKDLQPLEKLADSSSTWE